jgi:hypothetical protein
MKDSLLLKCIVTSGAFHAIAMAAFFAAPIHFHPNFFTTLGKTPPTRFDEDDPVILKKDAALAEAFRDFVVAKPPYVRGVRGGFKTAAADPHSTALAEEASLPSGQSLLLPDMEKPAEIAAISMEPLELPDQEVSFKLRVPSLSLDLPPPSIEPSPRQLNPFESITLQSLPEQQNIASEGLLDFEFLPSEEKFRTPITLAPELPSSHAAIASDVSLLSKQETISDPTIPLKERLTSFPVLKFELQPAAPIYSALPSLSHYGIPELSSIEWNDIFDVDIKTVAREEGGYLFSLSFMPKVDMNQHRLKQTYYFLIDRSNTIERNRYQSFKRAVIRSIGSLREGDHFNVIIFDSKISRLSETRIPYTKKNHLLAEEFLERQPHGHYGTPTDLFSSLTKIIPTQVNEEEAHTAILISDGESSLKLDKQRSLINAWLQTNRGRVTLYTAAVGHDNNLSTLDLLGTVSRGSLLYSETHTGFPRKLAKLVLTLRSAIAKDMTLTLTSTDPSSRLQIYPSSGRLPYLFSEHPFVLYGTADKLADFTLQLEGRNKGQVLSIKKAVSFAKAKSGNRLLSKQWATEQAHLFYEQYLQEGKPVLLEEAKKLLSDEPARSRR